MHGRFFTYDGEDSQAHSLAIAGLEQNDDVVFSLGREVFASQLNRYRNLVGHMGTRWNEVLVFNIQFIKDPCANASAANMYFTEDEVNDINTWLTSPDYPTLFHMYDYDFERDSSDSVILLDSSDISDGTFTVSIYGQGYTDITYTLENNEIVNTLQTSDIQDPKINPMVTFTQYDKWYALSCTDQDYLNAISRIVINDIEYENAHTNSWLSTYDSGGNMRHQYTILINTEKVLNNKYDYFGVFSDVQAQVIDGNVVGFNCTFTTDSPFAWTHQITQTVDGSATFTINSAEKYREIYPLIEITPTKDDTSSTRSKVKISNSVDGGEIKLNLMQGSPTVLDSRRSIIKDATGIVSFADLGISDMDYIYWPKLYHGENTITITGGTATITYREPRKVGDY